MWLNAVREVTMGKRPSETNLGISMCISTINFGRILNDAGCGGSLVIIIYSLHFHPAAATRLAFHVS